MAAIDNPDTFRLLGQVNLNHLVYFWAVAQTGSVTAAAKRLGVSQPSVSEQVRTLEQRLRTKLFDRGPRGVVLTPQGRTALRFAEEVVGVCADLVRSIPLGLSPDERHIAIGAADAVPKVVVRSILSHLLSVQPTPRLVCREWRVDHLLAELSLHRLDLVIADAPLPETEGSSLRSFAAGTSPVVLYGAPSLARKLRKDFPQSLASAPWLLPAEGASLRSSLDRWFALRRIRPRIAVEAEDRALLHHFAENGAGVVPVAHIIAADVKRQFGLVQIGALRNVQEEYYVIMIERHMEHPALESLRTSLISEKRLSDHLSRYRRPLKA